jgi:hypothetical protein
MMSHYREIADAEYALRRERERAEAERQDAEALEPPPRARPGCGIVVALVLSLAFYATVAGVYFAVVLLW